MRLLLVEDDSKLAGLIVRGLSSRGWQVDWAADGLLGWEMAQEPVYQVIILDIMLPGMDGWQICQKLRQAKINTPVLMLTALHQVDQRVKGLEIGADDYLPKPFAFSELAARVKALARRPETFADEKLEVADLVINLSNKQVTRAGKKIALSPTEYQLLEYLARHANQLISKQQLIEHVWGYDSDVMPNNVEAFIARLRRKLDKAFAKKPPLIETVRGFGYQLIDKP